MDGSRFDGLARALASTKTRRGYAVAALGFLGVAGLAVRGTTTDASQVFCRAEGEGCAMNSGCCPGHFCASTSLLNPNVGVCQRGTATRRPTEAAPPTNAPRPTRTPKPKRTPSPTPLPDTTPLQGSLDCSSATQRLVLRNESNETVVVTNITSIAAVPDICNPVQSPSGFRIRAATRRRRRSRVFLFGGCTPPPTVPSTPNCVSDCRLFEPEGRSNGAVVTFHTRRISQGTLRVNCL